MNNIDYFKQDISVGDIATIELTSGKSITGKVKEIGDCIIIEKEDGKMMRLFDGIIGGWELIEKEDKVIDIAGESTPSHHVLPKASNDDSLKEKTDEDDSDFNEDNEEEAFLEELENPLNRILENSLSFASVKDEIAESFLSILGEANIKDSEYTPVNATITTAESLYIHAKLDNGYSVRFTSGVLLGYSLVKDNLVGCKVYCVSLGQPEIEAKTKRIIAQMSYSQLKGIFFTALKQSNYTMLNRIIWTISNFPGWNDFHQGFRQLRHSLYKLKFIHGIQACESSLSNEQKQIARTFIAEQLQKHPESSLELVALRTLVQTRLGIKLSKAYLIYIIADIKKSGEAINKKEDKGDLNPSFAGIHSDDTILTSNSNNLEGPKSEATPGHEHLAHSKPMSLGEPRYGLKILGKIDLTQFERPQKSFVSNSEDKHDTPSSLPSDDHTTSSSKTKMKSIGNSLDALAQIDKSSLSQVSVLSLTPMGRITKIGPLFGYIFDYSSQRAIRFDIKDIIGERSDYSEKDLVVYSIAPNTSYGKQQANKIINILSVDELLDTAVSYLESGNRSDKQKALSCLRYVLKEYPKYSRATELLKNHFGVEPLGTETTKPDIVISPNTINALPLSLPPMLEHECKEKERELDLLIRSGQREECLQKSYELLSKRCPTPKYLKSYLDRIVNTEVALGNTQKAIEALAQLIAYSETQDTKATNLSHLYVSLARLLKQQKLFDEATKALDCAQYLTPGSVAILNLREQVNQERDNSLGPIIEQNDYTEPDPEKFESTSIVVGKMLQQDVEFRATSMEFEDNDPIKLLDRANGANKDSNKTFEFRAQLYLDAAAAFFKKGQDDSSNFKLAVANYARMKGNSMFSKLQNSIHKFPDNIDDLVAYSDSACNYYTEALGIYNGFGQKRYLQELFLKYLKLRKVSSQIQGGKTPDSDWYSGTLKSLLKECLSDIHAEDFKAFAYTCIAVGSAAEGAWNSLLFDKDGIGPFMAKLADHSYRLEAFKVFNALEQSNIDNELKANDFFHSIFSHRQDRIKQFSGFLIDRLNWQFSQFEIEAFKEEWQHIEDYTDILLTTDLKAVSSINVVISSLLTYAELNDSNRMQRLISSQQALIKSIETINETTTFYGRTFFYEIENQWLRSISRTIEEKYKETQPKLTVEPDPHFIKISEDGKQSINFVVINRGESTADSFSVKVSGNNIFEEIHYGKTVDTDKSISLTCPISLDKDDNSVSIRFEVITQYNGRTLSSSFFEHTYEKDLGKPFMSDIPWTIDGTPEKNVFVGRKETLDKLRNHYLSKERSHTYIMYGLTRTGKTSILDYLRENIDGEPLDDKPDYIIKAFSWPFQNVAYKKDVSGLNESRFWEFLIKTSLYDTLPENLQDIIDASYDDDNLPKIVGQNDFLKIIDILNENKVMPFFAVDEFSYVRLLLDSGTLNSSFLSILRDLSLNGKACFIYAGTYDIEELPRNKEYGITGQLVHTWPLPINSISDEDCDKLIDSWEELEFEPRAKEYIKNLSGRVPYWIQWICLDCGKYALSHNYHHLGYSEVNKVVQILTGEVSPAGDKTITWEKIDITNFQQNQYMPGENEDAECAVISCIAYLNRNNREHARGVSIKDMKYIWDKYNVSNEFQQKMIDAIKRMTVRCTLTEYTDEGRVVYKLNVDLFRRYWYAEYPNISTYLTLK